MQFEQGRHVEWRTPRYSMSFNIILFQRHSSYQTFSHLWASYWLSPILLQCPIVSLQFVWMPPKHLDFYYHCRYLRKLKPHHPCVSV